MDVKLILVKGNPKGKEVTIKEGTMIVGRKEDSGLIIASSRVSRHHCQITLEGQNLKIRDLGSANGTLVNNQRLEGEGPLKAGDQIQVGPLGFLVQIDGRPTLAEAERAPAAAPTPPTPPQPEAAPPQRTPPKTKGKTKEPSDSQRAAGRPVDDILAGLEKLTGDDTKKPPKK